MKVGDLISIYDGQLTAIVVGKDTKRVVLYIFDQKKKVRYYFKELDICKWRMISESR